MFNFRKQLAIGKKGESLFVKCYAFRGARKASGYAFDLWVDVDAKVELKTDTYTMEQSENFFIEQYGNNSRIPESLGGPWRALRDKLDFFVYLYIKDRTFYWFNPENFCKYLDRVIKKYPQKLIKNDGWTAVGYLIKRADVQHICLHKDSFTQDGRLLITL